MLRHSLALATLMAVTPAFAGSISYDFRFDHKGTTWNSDAEAIGHPTPASAVVGSNNHFELKTGRVDFKGSLSDTLAYRLRWRFDKTQTAGAMDNLGSYVDWAAITHKAADNVGVTVGKFGTEVGGWEGQSPTDQYIASEAYSGTGRSIFGIGGGTAAAAGNPAITNASALYLSGLRVDYGMGDHAIALQLGNNLYQISTDTTAAKQHQTRMATGFLYKGKVSMWKPILSYHMMDEQALTYAGGKSTFLGFGNRFDIMEGLWLDFDYLMNTYKNDGGTDHKVSGMNLEVGYKMGNLTPRFRYNMGKDEYTAATGGTMVKNDCTGMSLALEYKPRMEDNFRYHLAYNTNSWKSDVANAVTYANTEIIAGVRMQGDFLK